MKARIFAIATLAAISSGLSPAQPAGERLLNLVMPDAKVVAGINAAQAKSSAFGQYVLSQIAPQDQEIQKLVALIGFDPRRDIQELMVASNGTKSHAGLALAIGKFDAGRIINLAVLKGAKAEQTRSGVIMLLDPKQESGVAFPTADLAIFGDVQNVRAAIERLSAPAKVSTALAGEVNRLSTMQDAWVVTMVPPASLTPRPTAPQVNGLTQQTAFNSVQQASMGVKFGPIVTLTAQAVADTAENATAMVGVLQLLGNLAAMQSAKNPAAAELAKSMVVNSQGTVVNFNVSMPTEKLQELVKPARTQRAPRTM